MVASGAKNLTVERILYWATLVRYVKLTTPHSAICDFITRSSNFVFAQAIARKDNSIFIHVGCHGCGIRWLR